MSATYYSNIIHGGRSDQLRRMRFLCKKCAVPYLGTVMSICLCGTMILFLVEQHFGTPYVFMLMPIVLILVTAIFLCVYCLQKDDHLQPAPTNMVYELQPCQTDEHVFGYDTMNVNNPNDTGSTTVQNETHTSDRVRQVSSQTQTMLEESDDVNISSLPGHSPPGYNEIETGIDKESESDTRRPRTPPPSYNDVMDGNLYQVL